MSPRLLLVPAAIALAAAAAWIALRPPQLEPIIQAPATAATPAGPAAPAPRAPGVAAIDAAPAATPAQARRGHQVVIAPPPPTLFNEYLGARQYRILYERLADSPEGRTADGRLVLYEILRQCANVTEGRRPGYRANPPKREDFLASIPPSDPQRERRIAAYDAFTADRCQGLEAMTITRAELIKLLDESAAMGNPHARALAMEQALWQARRAGQSAISDDQLAQLREIAGTRDAEALRVAGRILANSWNDYQLRVGADQLPIEQRPFVNAFLVLSCEFGAPCGADTPRMQEACALRGHCNAQNYPDYLAYYASSQHDAAMLFRYRELVRHAITTGDWSQITVVRGAPTPQHRMTFVPGPR